MLQNPSSLYSGGQGLLKDNVVDYITKLENHKRAKDEALDKYYQNLPATINEKGVRDQDIPGLHQKINEVQQYWMENRDKIKKGNTPENFNYNRMWRDVKGGVTMSQNAAGTSLKLGAARLDPKKAYMFKGDDKTQALLSHEAPVWDATHKGIDLPQFESVQPLDTKKHLEPLAAIKPNELTPRYEAIAGDPYNRMEIKEKKYSPEDLNAVYLYSQEQLNNNGGFEKALETAVQNPETSAQLTDLFTKQYGREPKTETDLAAAYTLSLKGDATPTYKKVEDFGAKQNRRLQDRFKALGYSDELIKGRMKKAQEYKKDIIRFNKAASKAEEEGIVTKFIEKGKKEYGEGAQWLTLDGVKYGKGKFMQPTKTIADKFSTYGGKVNGQDVWHTPDALYITDDDKVIPVKFKRDEQGKVIVNPRGNTELEKGDFKPMTMQNFRVEVAKELITKKNQGAEVIDEFVGDEDPGYSGYIEHVEKGSNTESKPEKTVKKDPLGLF